MSKPISDLSVVRLEDGREGIIVFTHYASDDECDAVAYIIELNVTSELITVRPNDIQEVFWP